MTGKREQLGVELYGFQQQLARMQLEFDKLHEKETATKQARLEAEQELKVKSQGYQEHLDKRNELEQKMYIVSYRPQFINCCFRVNVQKELEKLRTQARQVDQFNNKACYNNHNIAIDLRFLLQVQSEILVTRRQAYGTEDHMQSIEKDKKKQDELIDQANEQVKQLAVQSKLLESQIRAQKEENAKAVRTLKEALKEMELVNIEKREYLLKWKSSLVGECPVVHVDDQREMRPYDIRHMHCLPCDIR